MTELRDLFDEMVSEPVSPRRLDPDDLFTTGRARHRRRTVAAGAALAAIMAVGAGTAVTLAGRSPTEPPVAGRTTVPRAEVPHPGERVQWAGAADRGHLYLSFPGCAPGGACAKTRVRIAGSDDGGRSWTDRGTPIDVAEIAVLGPEVLISFASSAPARLLISVDGARTWAPAVSSAPVASVSPGAEVICWSGGAERPCRLYAVDPAVRRLAPLASQPGPILSPAALDAPGSLVRLSDRLWVAGTDPESGRPAVAASVDGGRTWSTHVFADVSGCGPGRCVAPYLAGADGSTVYAVVTDPVRRVRLVYHGTAGRATGGADTGGGPAGVVRWTATPGSPLPYTGDRAFAGSYVTAGGLHLFAEARSDRAGGEGPERVTFWTLTAGGVREVQLDGLPAAVRPIRRTPGGWFYTSSYPEPVLYGSADGLAWSPVVIR